MMAPFGFVEAFCDKGRQSASMQSFSIDLITNAAAALISHVALAKRQLNVRVEPTE